MLLKQYITKPSTSADIAESMEKRTLSLMYAIKANTQAKTKIQIEIIDKPLTASSVSAEIE